MADLVEVDNWEAGIYQLETTDPVEGGPGGIDNRQAQALANRTKHLKAVQDAHAVAVDPHPQYLTQTEADALIEARVGDYSIDTGTSNAKVVALNPAIAAYVGNFSGAFKNALANTGACTVDFGGGPVPLVADAGAALANGDLPAGAVISYQYIHADGKAYVTSLVMSQGDARYVQTANVETAAGDPTGADNSAKPASTGWIRNAMANIATAAGFAYSFTANGYIKFPSWLGSWIVQWGMFTYVVGVTAVIPLPIAFPNACRTAGGLPSANNGSDFTVRSVSLIGIGTANISLNVTGGSTTSPAVVWFAIGY